MVSFASHVLNNSVRRYEFVVVVHKVQLYCTRRFVLFVYIPLFFRSLCSAQFYPLKW